MGVGEAMNLAAYAFAPVSVLAPFGALSLVFSAIIAARMTDKSVSIIASIVVYLIKT